MTIAPTPSSHGFEPALRTRTRARAAERGVSLIEIMVAMAIGLFIILIATTLYINGSSNVGFRIGQSENLSNGRYALNTLDSQFTKAGYRRDPTQSMDAAFPADAVTNGCTFTVGQAIYVTSDGALCIRFQARDNNEKDCAASAAGIPALKAYEPPPAPGLGAGVFVEKYFLKDGALVCQAGNSAAAATVPVADGVRDILFEFGVGQSTDSLAERRIESFKTTEPAATESIRSLRYAVLLASSAKGLTAGMETSICTRWKQLGGAAASCDTSQGQLYQLASGSLTLRNLMP